MSHYFIFKNNKVSEPIGVEELQRMAASGEISKQHLISVDGGDWVKAGSIRELFLEANAKVSAIKAPEPPRPSPQVTSQASWFYSKNGQSIGPMPEEAIKELARAGGIAADDLIWMSGQAEAIPATQAPMLAGFFQNQKTMTKKSLNRRDDNSKPIASRIAGYAKASAIIWLVLAIIQIIIGLAEFPVLIIIGLWNILASVQGFKLTNRIKALEPTVPDEVRGIMGLVIFGIANVLLGAVLGIVGIILDLYVRSQILKNEAIFSGNRRNNL